MRKRRDLTKAEQEFLATHVEHVHVGDEKPKPTPHREPHMSGRGTIAMGEEDLVEVDDWDISFEPTTRVSVPATPAPVGLIEAELPLAALDGAAAFFDNADMALLDKLLAADDGLRLQPAEREAFKQMRQRLDEDAGRSLTPKQLAWVQRTLDELEQNAADLTLLEEAIGEADGRGMSDVYDAFQDMVERIGNRNTLTARQRAWVQRVADGGR